MKNSTLRHTLMSLLLIVTLASCGPSYVGVRTGPGYGYYGARPYYYGYGYQRPPVVVVPAPRAYYGRPYYRNPGYRYNAPRVYGRTYGGRRGRW